MKNYFILGFMILVLLNSASADTYGSITVENSTKLYGATCTGTASCVTQVCLLEEGTCGCSLDSDCWSSSTPYCCQGVCKADCSTGESGTTTTIIKKSGGGTSKSTVSSMIEVAINQMMEEAKDLVISAPIYIEIYPGGYEKSDVSIRNIFDKSIIISAKVKGEVKDFITFENPFFELKKREESSLRLRINAEDEAKPGIYSGEIEIDVGDFTTKLPVRVKVLSPEAKLLDVRIEPLKESVKAGEKIPLQIDLYNLGQSKKVDVQLNIQLLNVDLDEVIKETEESLAIQTSMSILRTIKTPAYLNGKYVVRALVHYTNEDTEMVASSISTISITGGSILTGSAVLDLIIRSKFSFGVLVLIVIGALGFLFYKKIWSKTRTIEDPKEGNLGNLEVYDEPKESLKEKKDKEKTDEKVEDYRKSLEKRKK